MKRSELIRFSIECSKVECSMCQTRDRCKDCSVAVMKELLLAEQKREEGCPVCRGEVVVKDYFGHRCVKISGHYMEVANAEEEYPWNTVEIKACPFCAKALTDGESE